MAVPVRAAARVPVAVPVALSALVVTVVVTASPALARTEPATPYEMPFLCAQEWTGTTRSYHSPSPDSVDWNRPDDLGQPTLAAGPGVVTRVEDLGDRSYGIYVVVDHGASESTLYAHLLAEHVSLGQRVDQGQLLGRVGTSGGSTGPHLHYEQRHGGRVEPAWFGGERYDMGATVASGNCVDTPIAGDWDGDGRAEVGVFRRKALGVFRLRSADGVVRHRLGTGPDDPLVGDWDGDGVDDTGVHRSGTGTHALRLPDGSTSTTTWGRIADRPVAGDFDGDGTWEVAVWRPGSGRFRLPDGDGVRRVALGDAGSLPVTGDWDGDGRTDLGVFDDGTWTLRLEDGTGVRTSTVGFGGADDLPVTGDWNGNGTTDLAVWDPGTATFTLRRARPLSTAAGRVSTQTFGRPRG